MNGKKKGKKTRKKSAKSEGGLLSRWFKGDDKGDSKAGKGTQKREANGKTKAKPLSPLERSIQEIKHMAKVGKSDPERLAMLLSRLLSQEKEKERQAQETFDRMVWDIVKKEEEPDEDEEDADS